MAFDGLSVTMNVEQENKAKGYSDKGWQFCFISDKSETVDVEKRRDSDLVVSDSVEDIVHAPIAAGIKQAQVIKQSSRIKSKGSSSHNMRTRNFKFREAAEIEAAKVIVISSVLGLDFSEANEEMLEEITIREEENLTHHEAISG
ncbi:hypothetical protein QYF36_022977 [Acer negundo]|nr:hypothetical protein QYF36_022977 [Acer negundo]